MPPSNPLEISNNLSDITDVAEEGRTSSAHKLGADNSTEYTRLFDCQYIERLRPDKRRKFQLNSHQNSGLKVGGIKDPLLEYISVKSKARQLLYTTKWMRKWGKKTVIEQ